MRYLLNTVFSLTILLVGFALTSAKDAEAYLLQGGVGGTCSTTTESSLDCFGSVVIPLLGGNQEVSWDQTASSETWTIGSSVTALRTSTTFSMVLQDTIEIVGDFGTDESIEVVLEFRVTGSVGANTFQCCGETVIGTLGVTGVGGSNGTSEVRLTYDGTDVSVVGDSSGGSGFSSDIISTDPASIDFILRMTFDILAVSPQFDLLLVIFTGCSNNSTLGGEFCFTDFLDTGVLTVELPDGFAAIGSLGFEIPLAGDMQIPEPSSLALFGIGLAVLGFMTRRRKTGVDKPRHAS